jgi:hypothetical protein
MSASVELVCVPPLLKIAIWKIVADRLRAAYLKTDLGHTLDLERDVLEGDADLWLAVSDGEIEAAAVTLLVRTDKHLVCQIAAVGGKSMAQWLGLLPKIEEWAKRQGAAKVRIMGRLGWVCLLENYRVSNVVLERAL